MQADIGDDVSSQGLALARGAALQLHAMGTVIREIPGAIMQKVGEHYTSPDGVAPVTPWDDLLQDANTPSKQARVRFARTVDERLLTPIRENGICGQPVSGDFLDQVLTGNHRSPDQVVLVALAAKLHNDNGVKGIRYRPTGVAAWGNCEYEDSENNGQIEIELFYETRNDGDSLNDMVRKGRVAEIDLTCNAPSTAHFWHQGGIGRALLAYTLGRVAQRKKNRTRRYDAVIVEAAFAPNSPPPLRPSLLAMGFVEIPTWKRRNGQNRFLNTGKKYFVLRDDQQGLTWPQKVAAAVASEPILRDLCPVRPGTGKSYCV